MPDDTDMDHIEINAIHEKWRLECPNGAVGEGHTNWFPIDGVFRCASCAALRRQDPSIEPEYEQLRDKKTGELVSREQVRLAIDNEPAALGV